MATQNTLPRSAPPEGVFTAELLRRQWLSAKTFEIELSRPPHFTFKAGQIILLLYNGRERYYAVVSGPQAPVIALCVRFIEEGPVSSALASAEISTQLEFTGPHGYFTFKPTKRPAVFVATGTGIAPCVAMTRAGTYFDTVLHCVSSTAELYYRKRLQSSTRRYVPCISGGLGRDASLPECFQGPVTDYLAQYLPAAAYDFYLCGRQDMIRDVMHLIDDRFPASLVHYEVFYRADE